LILQNPRGWNEPLIRRTFLFHEAEEILNIRIPDNEGDDILAWHLKRMAYSLLEVHTDLLWKTDSETLVVIVPLQTGNFLMLYGKTQCRKK